MAIRKYPGLIEEMHHGKTRFRVRAKGGSGKRITVSVAPDHPDFRRQYILARQGVDHRKNERTILRAQGDLDANIASAVSGAKGRAKKKGVPFEISKHDLYDLLTEQEYRCAISGVKFNISKFGDGARNPKNISLHRINPREGYTRDNIRLVTTIVNIGISDFGEPEFIEMCKAVFRQVCPQRVNGADVEQKPNEINGRG